MAQLTLSGFHRTHLRGLAHPLKPTVQVGKDGVTDALVEQVEAQLAAHELVKIKLSRPPDKQALAEELAARTGSALCGLIGHTVILYRPDPETPRIELPKR